MQSLADRAAQALEVGKILDNDEHKNYLEAAKWCAERGYGRATHVETRVNLTPDDLRALTDEQLQRLTDGEDSVVVLANQGSGGVGAEAPAGAGELDRESDEDGA